MTAWTLAASISITGSAAPAASGASPAHCAGSDLLHHAAFLLHQAVERDLHALLLVFTGYKPRTHDIELLAKQSTPLHPALTGALPRAAGEDKRLFDLLGSGPTSRRAIRRITG